MKPWYDLEIPEIKWLVAGLLPADGYSAIVGKPKAGKSTLIRNLVVSVIQSKPFLGRSVNIPVGQGKVLYIHLDRKDRPGRVAGEMKQLGILEADSDRLQIAFSEDLPTSTSERLEWVQEQVRLTKPHLLVIDLMLQFLEVQNQNDYKQMLTAVNDLQDALNVAGFEGALVAAFHSRKACNPDQPADDILGSTAIRGSFGSLIMLTQDRVNSRYVVMSDQTDREEPWGELQSTEIIRNADGLMSLGRLIQDIQYSEKRSKQETDSLRLSVFLDNHPASSLEQIVSHLGVSKKTALELIRSAGDAIQFAGAGVKGDPKLYSSRSLGTFPFGPEAFCPQAQVEADRAIALESGDGGQHA